MGIVRNIAEIGNGHVRVDQRYYFDMPVNKRQRTGVGTITIPSYWIDTSIEKYAARLQMSARGGVVKRVIAFLIRRMNVITAVQPKANCNMHPARRGHL